MNVWRRYWTFTPVERHLVWEALWRLTVVRAALAWLPFRRVTALFGLKLEPPGVGPEELSPPATSPAETLAQIRTALERVSPRLPFRAACLEQALAAAWMLNRRGLPVRLHLGTARRDGSLVAHAWLESCGQPVVGHGAAMEFTRLATFASWIRT